LWTLPLLDRQILEADLKPHVLPTSRAFAPRYGGKALFYLSSRGGADGLWRFQDGEATEIWRGVDGALQEPPAMSPDGRRAAVILREGTKRTLNTLSSDGGDLRPLTEAFDVSSAVSWSPDGKWIAASGADAQGPGLFKIAVDGGKVVRLKPGQTSNPVWSSDGSVIAFAEPITARIGRIQMIDPDGESMETPLMRVRVGGERYRFVPGRPQLVYMLDTDSARQSFWMYDVATKKTRQLASFDLRGTRTFDVTPDGTQIVFDRVRDNADIVLIDRAAPAER
jgi:Tol biopolymer transport system component